MSFKYTPPEIEKIHELAERDVFVKVHEKYNKWAIANNYRERSLGAFEAKLYQLGYSRVPCGGDWLTVHGWGEELGISPDTIWGWQNKGWLTSHKAGKLIRISKRALTDFAKRHPGKLKDIPYHVSCEVFGTGIADLIQSAPPSTRQYRVFDSATGTTHSSLRECARKVFLSPNTVKNWVKKKQRFSLVLRGENGGSI